MIVVDTSVWVEHLRQGSPRLRRLLEEGEVLCHPHVIGELACGTLTRRGEVLGLLRALPRATVASDEEAHRLVEAHGLHGRGIAGSTSTWSRPRCSRMQNSGRSTGGSSARRGEPGWASVSRGYRFFPPASAAIFLASTPAGPFGSSLAARAA